MKRSSNIASKLVCLLVLFVAAIFVGADLPASAQNTNSSTTSDSMMQNTNGNMNGSMGRRRPRRRPRRRARRNMNANTGDASNANMSTDAPGNANMSTDTSGNANMATDTSTQDSNVNTSMSGGSQGGSMPGMGTFGDVANLSGTYTGTVNYPDGGMTGEATLTITENTFTIAAGSATQSGTLSARSWPGYTALSMRFGDALPATIISTRAWHKGKNLRIQSVRGESRVFSFNGRGEGAGGGAAMSSDGGTTGRRSRGRRRPGRRRGRSNTMMATPDAPPAPTPTPTPGR